MYMLHSRVFTVFQALSPGPLCDLTERPLPSPPLYRTQNRCGEPLTLSHKNSHVLLLRIREQSCPAPASFCPHRPTTQASLGTWPQSTKVLVTCGLCELVDNTGMAHPEFVAHNGRQRLAKFTVLWAVLSPHCNPCVEVLTPSTSRCEYNVGGVFKT